MADTRVKYNFQYDDTRNFLILLGNHLKSEGLELIPSGFILKQPEIFVTDQTNVTIDVIGIPFRNVYNRVKMYYHRVTLSEFYALNKLKMGTINRPIRIEYTGDKAGFIAAVKKKVAENLKIPETRFKLEEADFNIKPKALKFKFTILPSEFTTEDEGLCLHNDFDCYIYVDDPNIKIENGFGKIDIETHILARKIYDNSIPYSINTSFGKTELSNINNLLPDYLYPEFIGVEEDIVGAKNNEVFSTPRAVKLVYKVDESILESIKAKTEIASEGYLEVEKSAEDNTIKIKLDLSKSYKKLYIEANSPIHILPLLYVDDIYVRMNYNSDDRLYANTRISKTKFFENSTGIYVSELIRIFPRVKEFKTETIIKDRKIIKENTMPVSFDIARGILNAKTGYAETTIGQRKFYNNQYPIYVKIG